MEILFAEGTLVSETQSLKFPRYNYAGVEIEL